MKDYIHFCGDTPDHFVENFEISDKMQEGYFLTNFLG